MYYIFFFQGEDGIRYLVRSRGLGDVYKRQAILFSKGRIVGKFGPGKYTLNTENLPILRNLFGLPFGQKNPFTAEVWFVNRILTFNIDWKIDRMDIHDADYNTGIPLIAKGTYGLRIEDAERFLIKIVGSKNVYNQHDLTDQFYGEFSSKTKSTLMQEMICLLYTSPSPRDRTRSRMPSSAWKKKTINK